MRILVVDGNRDVADSHVMLFDCLGKEALAAYSGSQGLAALAEFEPDVVFISLVLPDMDGVETARLMQQRCEHLILIALTGLGGKKGRESQLSSWFFQAPRQACEPRRSKRAFGVYRRQDAIGAGTRAAKHRRIS